MADAVTATETDPLNPAQAGGPAIPNVDRKPADTPADKPADTPADKPADKPADEPTAEPPVLGDPADAPKPEGPTSADADENGVITYEPTGDAGLDVALAFVGKLGVGMDDPAMMATASGDFSLIKAKLATMGDKATGWEQMVALAEQAHERHVAKTSERNGKITAAVSGVLGEAQADILAWASENADDSERADINAMLAAGPVQARAAAQMLLDAYTKATGTVVNPASATTGSPSTGAAPSQSQTGPLTNKEFARASAKLHGQYGNAYINTPEYRALVARLG